MQNPAQPLIDLKKAHDFLICIDSDGCAFDTMEIKHKECFCPNTINEWGLQAVSKYAREAAEFVNLYSKYRGINRFPALLKVFELLKERREVIERGFKLPDYAAVEQWTNTEKKLGNPALIRAVEETRDPVLERALRWSNAVNETVERFVHGVPPFPYVRESLAKIQNVADAIVVSATPGEALNREWAEHDIDKYVKAIAGQEMGNKAHCIELAKTGRYDNNHVLMVGDAPGDMKAAKQNGVLFYPINPGDEDKSWKRFFDEALDKFINLTYEGEYERKLIEEFDAYLPELPPWKLNK
ncbi:MAG: HAD family hydrolase [Clostridiales bacterium]|jgi:phosphoglycolate phosphatase-like HAD superfamily hydrolase|nr:HAD family hydrolase [Clostridiales bacterium]